MHIQGYVFTRAWIHEGFLWRVLNVANFPAMDKKKMDLFSFRGGKVLL
jgi:hypothetical protein